MPPRLGTTIQKENAQMKSRGFAIGTLDDIAAKRTWYRPDGKAIHNLPCDTYHREVYINKGWSLTPPAGADEDLAEELQGDADDEESAEEVTRKPRRGKRVPNPVDELVENALAEEPLLPNVTAVVPDPETEVQAPDTGESE